MSLNETESYLKTPLFQEAMDHFRVGKWEEGFTKLGEVEKNYPMEPDLRTIRQEMDVRARITRYEMEENKQRKLHQLGKYSLRSFVTLVVLVVAFFTISTYSGWIQGQIVKAQALKDIEIQYTQAMSLLQLGDSAQALVLLQDISQKMPNYRDVSLQVKSLQTQSEMTSVMQQADQAFAEGRYEDALSGYESLRLMDSSYQTGHVDDYLFQSYVKAAEALLAEPVPSMETLKKIDTYFSKALALRPLDREALAARIQVRLVIEDGMIGDYVSQAQAALASAPDSLEAQQLAEKYLGMALAVRPNDPNVLIQFQLAQAFIQAVSDFASSKWDLVIEKLETVIGQQAGYASGTANQTLYDANIARGSAYIA